MFKLPQKVDELLVAFSRQFCPSVWERFVALLMAAVMQRRRRTIWRLILWTDWALGNAGHFSSFHRVFSERVWSSRMLAKILAKSLVAIFAPHQHHLNYAERLNDGKTLGSGQIEGACKNMIGRRLKANDLVFCVRESIPARWKQFGAALVALNRFGVAGFVLSATVET